MSNTPGISRLETRFLAVVLVGGLLAACEPRDSLAETPVARRITGRTFPSVFQAWNPADNLNEERVATEARHDLIFHGERFFGLRWDHAHPGLATAFTPASISVGLERRRELLRRNPNMVLLMEIRYRDAWGNPAAAGAGDANDTAPSKQRPAFLPANHRWWKRDGNGRPVAGWEEGGYFQLDVANPEYREQVARQCKAAVRSGVVDGVMLDWWTDDDDRLALVKDIRQQIGDDALILVNANDRQTPRTASFVNGLFMECYRSKTPADWRRIAETLIWAETHLRSPRINCVETWHHGTRADAHLMRATTTLALVHADGYCLFSDPNPLSTPDHLHSWYPFWERRLGMPAGLGVPRADGAVMREFTRGTAVYNPMGNEPVTIQFDEPRDSVATGKRSQVHAVEPCDGDVFLRVQSADRQPDGDRRPATLP